MFAALFKGLLAEGSMSKSGAIGCSTGGSARCVCGDHASTRFRRGPSSTNCFVLVIGSILMQNEAKKVLTDSASMNGERVEKPSTPEDMVRGCSQKLWRLPERKWRTRTDGCDAPWWGPTRTSSENAS